jgi:hypothetical protein
VYFMRSTSPVARLWAALGIIACPLAVLLTGQRGSMVIVGLHVVALAYVSKRQISRGGAVWRRIQGASVFTIILFVSSLVAWQVTFRFERIDAKLGAISADSTVLAAQAQQELDLPPAIGYWLARLPIGDSTWRIALNIGGVLFFLRHPWGIGYGRELEVMGWLSHYELTTAGVEQGLFGLITFGLLFKRLKRFAASRGRGESFDQDGVALMRCVTVVFIVASVMAMNAITLWKYGFVYWTLLGVCDAALSALTTRPSVEACGTRCNTMQTVQATTCLI